MVRRKKNNILRIVLRDFLDNIKDINICIIGVPEVEERASKELKTYLKK